MQGRHPFGSYLPDLPGLDHPGLTVAKNAVPRQRGYGQQLSPSVITNFTALDDQVRGQLAMIDNGGNPHHFSGTSTKLYHLDTQTNDVSRTTGGAYNATAKALWEFVLFGQTTIAVSPFDDPQYFTIPSSTNFDQLSPEAPRAYHAGIVGQQVVLGNTNDSLDGPVNNRIWWSAIGNPFLWPTPGTDDAVQVQSDFSDLEGSGGGVQRVIGGAEVGAIFQERAIWRMDYVGSPVIYQLSRVEPNRGLLIPGLAVAISRLIFYLAEDGFYVFDYTSSQPIGKDQINRTFLSDVDSDFFYRVTSEIDPDNTRFFILYPGSGHNAAGDPNKWLCYDWALQRWSHGEYDGDILAHVLPLGIHLDIDKPAPNQDPLLDAPIGDTLDELVASTGALSLGMYDENHRLANFTGTPLAAVFETGDIELVPGRLAMLDYVRPHVRGDNTTVTVRAAARPIYNKPVVYGKSHRLAATGQAGIRRSGRYHRVLLDVKNGFDEVLGFDHQFTQGGWR